MNFQLPTGLRVILIPSESDVVYAGIAVAVGTRSELDSESGMAHLVEHMTFKGTSRLTSVQILNRMESVGGDLNAYTGKEETIYYATFLRPHLRRAIPLLLDIVFNSTFPQDELEKEREVVIDEIESYNDSPAELIFDDFEALLFPHHPLGRNILGDPERLRHYTTADLQSFVRRNYHPSRAVLFVKGRVSEKEIESLLKNEYSRMSPQTEDPPLSDSNLGASLSVPSPSTTSLYTYNRSTHQQRVARGLELHDRHVGLALLSNILGGPAMNSRLSLALRERTGLVYTVESNYTAYTDTGVWSIYFGCDHADVKHCLRLVNKELRRLTDAPLTPRTLAAAKRQLKGQLGIAADNSENVALSAAKQYLHTHYVKSLEQRFAEIDALTSDQLLTIARDIMNPDRLTTLIYQ